MMEVSNCSLSSFALDFLPDVFVVGGDGDEDEDDGEEDDDAAGAEATDLPSDQQEDSVHVLVVAEMSEGAKMLSVLWNLRSSSLVCRLKDCRMTGGRDGDIFNL